MNATQALASSPPLLVRFVHGPRSYPNPHRGVDFLLKGRLAYCLRHIKNMLPSKSEISSRRFDGLPDSVAAARRFTRDALVKFPIEGSETAVLLVSELVTNAVRYGLGSILLTLTVHGTSLRCEVTDANPAAPRLKEAAVDDETGRGMQLLHELSHRCGVRPARHGKTVWFELEAAHLAGEPGADLPVQPFLGVAGPDLAPDLGEGGG
ncbi:ATP-binding protein [Streptomyces bicolor]|uniref:ATP-binding protein n=1 Tax=Streptomyces bicolor TaxID=66874 RepID=UPI0009982FCD|nr:ATP-binding protein [Streptomyces bicolor]